MSKNPLSDKQLESLADYCAARKVSIFDFLFNEMQFLPVDLSQAEARDGKINIWVFNHTRPDLMSSVYYFEPKGPLVSGTIYLATSHSISKGQRGQSAWLDFKGVNPTRVDPNASVANVETVRLADATQSAGVPFCGWTFHHYTPMFFQAF